MAFKKKKKDKIEDWDDSDDEIEIPSEDETGEEDEDDLDEKEDGDEDLDNDIPEQDDITSSLQLANKTLQSSEIVKQLPEALPEIRIAFLKEGAAKEVKHSAKNYDNFRYIRKILKLQKYEDDLLIKNRKKLYQLKTHEDLKIYLKNINRSYLYTMLENSGQLDVAIAASAEIKENGLAQDYQNITNNLHSLYLKYNKDYGKLEDVDDTGQIQNIAMESIVSSGTGGNERQALISTIASTKNLDTESSKVKAQRERSFGNRIAKQFRKYI